MLLAFLHLAARRGEIFRIKFADIDFAHQQIRLWTRKRDGGMEVVPAGLEPALPA